MGGPFSVLQAELESSKFRKRHSRLPLLLRLARLGSSGMLQKVAGPHMARMTSPDSTCLVQGASGAGRTKASEASTKSIAIRRDLSWNQEWGMGLELLWRLSQGSP